MTEGNSGQHTIEEVLQWLNESKDENINLTSRIKKLEEEKKTLENFISKSKTKRIKSTIKLLNKNTSLQAQLKASQATVIKMQEYVHKLTKCRMDDYYDIVLEAVEYFNTLKGDGNE